MSHFVKVNVLQGITAFQVISWCYALNRIFRANYRVVCWN